MIRKPKRISVRFSEYELNEMELLQKLSHCWNTTDFVRNAISFYRRHLYEVRDQAAQKAEAEATAKAKAGAKQSANKRKPKAIAG